MPLLGNQIKKKGLRDRGVLGNRGEWLAAKKSSNAAPIKGGLKAVCQTRKPRESTLRGKGFKRGETIVTKGEERKGGEEH